MDASPHPRAFVLLVHLTFATAADAQTWLEAFRPLAEHCKLHEPRTLMYEAAVSDDDGTKVVIMERYTCKEDLTEVHQKSAPFLAFREHPVQKLVVSKSGQSYYEANVGYACVPSKGY